MNLGNLLRRAGQDTRGIALTEFALALPILTLLGMYGIELAYMTVVNMEVAQIATSVADNTSRLGQTENSAVTPTVTEAQVDSVMAGALAEGNSFNFQTSGRIVLSSLEVNAATGSQYIHWQRCRGSLAATSAYGKEGATVTGMGPTGHKITAGNGSAVMYVEVFYQYKPLFGTMFVQNTTFRREAAFLIRDNRNLTPTGSTDGVTGTGGQSVCT